jgi:hypothetical protein
VHRLPALLPYAVRSVLDQRRGDFELFIVCDGAPEETAAAAYGFAAEDRRIRVFAHPKGERNGEAWRHLALQQAAGRYVCHIADDDLWFDDHLIEVERLLATADLGNTLSLRLAPDGRPSLPLGDLAIPAVRASMQALAFNFFGLSSAFYRLEAYRALPVGWSPAPPEVWSDLFMWRKFFAAPGLTFATCPIATTLGFPTPQRLELTLEQRRQEIGRYAGLIRDPGFRDDIWRRALLAAAAEKIGLLQQLSAQGRKARVEQARAEAFAGALQAIVAAAGDSQAQRDLAAVALEAHQRAAEGR